MGQRGLIRLLMVDEDIHRTVPDDVELLAVITFLHDSLTAAEDFLLGSNKEDYQYFIWKALEQRELFEGREDFLFGYEIVELGNHEVVIWWLSYDVKRGEESGCNRSRAFGLFGIEVTDLSGQFTCQVGEQDGMLILVFFGEILDGVGFDFVKPGGQGGPG